MNSDFKDALCELNRAEVRYLVVGGYAVIHYAEPRFTKDLDIWLEPSPENAQRVAMALRLFGVPLIGLSEEDLAVSGTQFMIGLPPNAIDFITTCSDLEFEPCWERRNLVDLHGLVVPYLSLTDLISGKESLGRDQDRMDARILRQVLGANPETP